LLKYRYRRLDDARAYAKENGYKGAMIPWQTADDGKEETQEVHYNPMADSWGPDLSRAQRHVSIAVAFNMLRYYDFTRDNDFIREFGGEVILEICRFWASIARLDDKDGRYHIEGVMGPDEFHEKYPDKSEEEGGIRDNSYTNIMVSWLFSKADHIKQIVPDEVEQKIGLKQEEVDQWKEIAQKLTVVMNEDEIISQYDGYFELDELDWDHYKKKYPNYHRMDRILKSEGDSPDHYKVAKQADALMAYYLITPEEVKGQLEYMGYKIKSDPMQLLKKNYEYYVERTSHGSTLSFIVHSYLLHFLDLDKSVIWEWYYNALKSDINDSQGGTTPEGIHCGVMAGTIDIIYNSFAGVEPGDVINVMPDLPDHWNEVSFKNHYRGEWYEFTVNKDEVIIKSVKGNKARFSIAGKEYSIPASGELKVNYS
jgi:trehalose/maltose hydrolase-like predicted phosphorylase